MSYESYFLKYKNNKIFTLDLLLVNAKTSISQRDVQTAFSFLLLFQIFHSLVDCKSMHFPIFYSYLQRIHFLKNTHLMSICFQLFIDQLYLFVLEINQNLNCLFDSQTEQHFHSFSAVQQSPCITLALLHYFVL